MHATTLEQATAGPYASDVVKGALAGAAATWVMSQATTMMYEHESAAAREQEDRARGGRTAYQVAAERIAHLAGTSLRDEQRDRAASAIHWSTGIAAGIAYALARRRWPGVAWGNGVAFGLGFFLAVDEAMNTALGFTPPPTAFPWQAHARGALGHTVFGLVASGAMLLLDRAHRPRRQVEAMLSAM